MARRKQVSPLQRINSGEVMQAPSTTPEKRAAYTHTNGHLPSPSTKTMPDLAPATRSQQPPSLLTLLICVGGIYASFLTWGVLQERITTTPYHLTSSSAAQPQQEYFRYPLVLNTIQSFFAFTSGSLYLFFSRSKANGANTVIPSKAALWPLALVTATTTLASPFGYASLAHVDYLTFVLAKSCKLLPVMALHVMLFRKRYPLQKYLIVAAVTGGVALFTIYHPPKPGKQSSKARESSLYGLSLLGVNLLFDGLTNTVQDHIFASPHRYGKIVGPQMMVILNFMSTVLMSSYLFLTPYVPLSLLPAGLANSVPTNELSGAIAFLQRHPSVLQDVLLFSASGAIGQLFIYATLERFSSLLLVTVTVTRKMLTMLLSVAWFGHRLGGGQWLGVGLVFGGVVLEGLLGQREKAKREREKLLAEKNQ